MIIEKKATQAAQGSVPTLTATDLPPPYYNQSYHPSQSATSATPAPRTGNFVSVKRDHGNIAASYVIDPTLAIPESLLPPLEAGETRKNLSLSTQYAPINADVTVLSKDHDKKVTISVTSSHCEIKCKLHRASNSPPISLEVRSTYGPVKVFLPRSFQGSVTASTTHGIVQVSNAVAAHQTTFSDIDKTLNFFVGDVSRYLQQGGMNWEGDEAVIESNHSVVKIYYEDEVKESRGLFEKIWDSITL